MVSGRKRERSFPRGIHGDAFLNSQTTWKILFVCAETIFTSFHEKVWHVDATRKFSLD
jgi:hypothetical protein